MRQLARCALLAVAGGAGVLAPMAHAQPRATTLPCGHGVQVSSNGAPLRELLQELAGSLHFELKYLASENPPIRLDGRLGTLELIELLSEQANLAVRYRRDPACKGQLKIASIWVLSRASGASATRSADAPVAAPGAVPASLPPAVAAPPSASGDGQAEYLRLHGLPSPPQH